MANLEDHPTESLIQELELRVGPAYLQTMNDERMRVVLVLGYIDFPSTRPVERVGG